MNRKSLNRIVIGIFGPLLILVGLAGFIVPAEQSLTSGAPAYNVFHICFGLIALVIFWSKSESLASLFNLGFGLIDLYQALASYLNLPPQQQFLWTRVDDALHVVIGISLILIGGYGISTRGRATAT